MVRYVNQDVIYQKLIEVFGEDYVVMEWDVVKGSQDGYTRKLYCPRIDFAIGPFNINRNFDYNNQIITEKYNEYEELFNLLIQHSDMPNNSLTGNSNPRCFLTVEHENEVTRKHMIGTIINASAIGKVGIIIAAQEKTYRALLRIRKYLESLVRFNKLNYKPENIIIIKFNEFMTCMQQFGIDSNNEHL